MTFTLNNGKCFKISILLPGARGKQISKLQFDEAIFMHEVENE